MRSVLLFALVTAGCGSVTVQDSIGAKPSDAGAEPSEAGAEPSDAGATVVACDLSIEALAVTLTDPAGAQFGRDATGKPAANNIYKPLIIQGAVVAASADTLQIQTCEGPAPCSPAVWTLALSSAALKLDVPIGLFVELWFQSRPSDPKTGVLLRRLDVWNGAANAVPSPPLLLLVQLPNIADPDHPEHSPFDLALAFIDCPNEPDFDNYAWQVTDKMDPTKVVELVKSTQPTTWTASDGSRYRGLSLGSYDSNITGEAHSGLWITAAPL